MIGLGMTKDRIGEQRTNQVTLFWNDFFPVYWHFIFLDRDNRTESDMEIDQSEPSDQNSPADHELGPKRGTMNQPIRGRNPSGKKYRAKSATRDGKS